MFEILNFDYVGIWISDCEKLVVFYELLGFEMIVDGGYDVGYLLVMLYFLGININLFGFVIVWSGENILMDEKLKYSGIIYFVFKMKDVGVMEDFVIKYGIFIIGCCFFCGIKIIFICDLDCNVFEFVGSGLLVVELIVEYVYINED